VTAVDPSTARRRPTSNRCVVAPSRITSNSFTRSETCSSGTTTATSRPGDGTSARPPSGSWPITRPTRNDTSPPALPDLPFADDAFDLTLSANLLFLYDDRLEEGFHHEAMAELSRVTDGEVRVFTLASLDRERSEFVEPVVERLRADGHGVEFREVPYEFQPGATEMLVVEAG